MKNKISFYSYITASLSLIVPVPGRFAYGLVLMLLLNFLVVTGSLFRKLVHVLDLDQLYPVLLAVFLMTMSIISRQILIIFSPIMALTLGFLIYMPAVSSFLIGCLYNKTSTSLIKELSANVKNTLCFSLLALIVYLFRDIFGFGTFTLPSHYGIFELILVKYNPEKTYPGIFLATIPGALIIVSLCLVELTHFINKSEEAANDSD